MKREIPLAITFITGILVIITFFIPHRPFGDFQQRSLIWFSIVAGFTMLLGIDSLIRGHGKKILRRQEGWGYSIALIAGVVSTVSVGLYSWARWGTPFQLGSPFMYMYTYAIIPLESTMFAILSFFIASTAYRAFRAKTMEATLLLVAIIVMLGRVPAGTYLYHLIPYFGSHHPGALMEFQEWIMDVPQLAAKRGIMIGAYLGAVAMSLRIILGIERTYLS